MSQVYGEGTKVVEITTFRHNTRGISTVKSCVKSFKTGKIEENLGRQKGLGFRDTVWSSAIRRKLSSSSGRPGGVEERSRSRVYGP